jgi:hypothetical protein
VTSFAAIRDFKANLTTFREDIALVLDEIRHKILNAIDYIERDRPVYWKNQIRRGFDDVAAARSRLSACQLQKTADFQPSCIEEKEELAMARRKLRRAQETVERVQHWGFKLRNELNEFHGRTAQLDHCMHDGVPQALLFLERAATILESYADVRPTDTMSPEQIQNDTDSG